MNGQPIFCNFGILVLFSPGLVTDTLPKEDVGFL